MLPAGGRKVGALVVTDLTNVRWLTGFTGSNGSVAVLPYRLVLVTDGRYRDRANDELAAAGVEAEVVVGFNQSDQHDALVAACAGIDEVGAEAATITYARWRSLSAELALCDAGGVIENERRVKDAGEIARIAWAAELASSALPTLRRCSRPNRPRPTCAANSSTGCACTAPTVRATTRSWPAGPTMRHVRTTRSGTDDR